YRVYGPAVDEPLVEVNLANGAKPTAYLHHDALGSITCATDPNGNVVYRNSYRAFGQRTSTTTPNTDTLANAFTRLSYTSRETSVGSLYQYRSRYYDAGYGRFSQQDTYEGESDSPPSLNRYTYTFGNPICYKDPSGHLSVAQTISFSVLALIIAGGFAYVISCLSQYARPNLALAACLTELNGAILTGPLFAVSFAVLQTVFELLEFFFDYQDGIFGL